MITRDLYKATVEGNTRINKGIAKSCSTTACNHAATNFGGEYISIGLWVLALAKEHHS